MKTLVLHSAGGLYSAGLLSRVAQLQCYMFTELYSRGFMQTMNEGQEAVYYQHTCSMVSLFWLYRLYMSAIISTSSSAASCCAFMGSMSPLSVLLSPGLSLRTRRPVDTLQRTVDKKSPRCSFFFNLQVCSTTRVCHFRSHRCCCCCQ